MNRFKFAMTAICLSLAAVAFAPVVQADDWNKKTIVTFSEPIEVPGGVILPAGTYVFKLLDSQSNRHVVQIFSEDEKHVFATILAIPNWRLVTTDKTVMTFGESPAGIPQAIRAWFYPGANSGEEFVYSKRRARELARASSLPVYALLVEMEPVITQPADTTDQSYVALRGATVTTVTPTGEESDIAQDATPEPPAVIEQTTATADLSTLPQTASQLPLVALLGLLSLCVAFGLWAFPKLMDQGENAKFRL